MAAIKKNIKLFSVITGIIANSERIYCGRRTCMLINKMIQIRMKQLVSYIPANSVIGENEKKLKKNKSRANSN